MTELTAAARFVHLAAAVLLAGSFGFVALIARPAPGIHPTIGIHLALARWSVVAVMVSALAVLWLQAVNVAGSGAMASVAPLLTETAYGHVWLARMVLALLLAALIFSDPAHAASRGWMGAGLSLALLASGALAGHAAAGEGVELVTQMLFDALHLAAAGLWIGGLVPLFFFLRLPAGGLAATREAVRRYSLLGIACVSTLVVSGVSNAANLVGDAPQLFGTAYGQLLLLKVLLLLPLLAVAAMNLLRINPAIASRSADASENIARLKRNVVIEAVLGFTLIAIVGWLGVTPPARHVQPEWPFAFRWDWALVDRPKARAEFDGGLMWCSAGLTAVVSAFFAGRAAPWLLAAGAGLLAYSGSIVFGVATTDAYPTTYRRPEVAYHAISVASGKELYSANCVSCHGPGGYGDGPAAAGLKPKPADLTAAHANDHTAGDLYWWLSHGVRGSAMPGFEATLTEEERWDLINFVRALAGGERGRSLAPVIEERAWLVAPDFFYTTASGESRALKDHRGARMVLLVIPEDEARARLDALQRASATLGGVEILVVPPSGANVRSPLPTVVEGNDEIRATYSLFARGFGDAKPGPVHAEFLIDRQGYIRARWLPSEGAGWSNMGLLEKQVAALRAEKPRAPAPAEHVH